LTTFAKAFLNLRSVFVAASERPRRSIVVVHPFVVGELACGNFSNRDATLELLQQLRSVTVAEHDEVMSFIRARELAATLGIAAN
jgi:hypothetical protein